MARNKLVLAFIVVVISLTIGQAVANKKEKTKAVAGTKQELVEPESDTDQDNFVQLHFMDFKRKDFIEVLPQVKTSIADSLSKFCSNHASKCGIQGSINFTDNDINFLGNNEKDRFLEEGRFVIAKLFATLPGENEVLGDQDVDVKAVSQPILEEFMNEHSQEIAKEAGVPIAYVNDKLVYPPRNNLDNYLIVGISCGFCIILIIVNLICLKMGIKKSKKEFLAKVAVEQSRPLLRPAAYTVQTQPPAPAQAQAHTHTYYTPSQSNRSDSIDIKMSRINAISRHDSFDQKLDTRTGASSSSKRRKRHRTVNSSNQVPIVGNVGQGIGSPRNIAETIDGRDDYRGSAYRLKGSQSNEWLNDGRLQNPYQQQAVYSRGGGGRGPAQHLSTNSLNKNEINIPIERIERYEQTRSEFKNYTLQRVDISEYADPKVAYRLASSERL